MKVWELSCIEGAPWTDSPSWTVETPNTFDGRSKINEWVEFSAFDLEGLTFIDDTNVASFYGGVFFILDDKAASAVSQVARGEVELLPVEYKDERAWLLNVTCVLGCLDLEKSVYSTFSTGRLMNVDAYWFDPESIEGHAVFKLREMPLTRIFVTDSFKDEMERQGVRGLDFVLVWDSGLDEPIMHPLVRHQRGA